MKFLYLDCETTGKDAMRHGVLQIAGIIEVDGMEKETFNLRLKPVQGKMIDAEALAVNGITQEQIRGFQDAGEGYKQVLEIFDRYIDKYNKKDKFYMIGHNPHFDYKFLEQFFKDHGNQYLYAYINYHLIDTVDLSVFFHLLGKFNPASFKLKAVCEELGIEADFHDAMEDIQATRKVFKHFLEGSVSKWLIQ